MPLGDTLRRDLLPTAEVISQEALLCSRLAQTLQGHWTPEHEQLVALTYSSGIAQLLHFERLLRLECLEQEMSSAFAEA